MVSRKLVPWENLPMKTSPLRKVGAWNICHLRKSAPCSLKKLPVLRDTIFWYLMTAAVLTRVLGIWYRYYGVDPTSFPRWKMYRISYIGFFKLWGPRKFSYPTSNIIFQGRKLENLKAYGWKPRKYLGFQFPMFPQKPHSFPRWRDLGKVWGFKGFCQHFFITIGILADFCCHE